MRIKYLLLNIGIVVITWSLNFSTFAFSSDWPTFMGDNARNGNAGNNLNDNINSIVELWKQEYSISEYGRFYNPPIISGDYIVLSSRNDDIHKDSRIYCINKNTRKTVWVWPNNDDEYYHKLKNTFENYHVAFKSSPYIYKNRVYINIKSMLLCLDLSTGKAINKYMLLNGDFFNDINPISIENDILYSSSSRGLDAFDLIGWKQKWHFSYIYQIRALFNTKDVEIEETRYHIIANNKIYSCFGDILFIHEKNTGKVLKTFSIGDDVCYMAKYNDNVFISNGKILCFNSISDKLVWQTDKNDFFGTLSISNRRIFAGSSNGFYCLDMISGLRIWRNNKVKNLFFPITWNERIFGGTDNNRNNQNKAFSSSFVMLDCSYGSLLEEFKYKNIRFNSPSAISQGKIYSQSNNILFCYGTPQNPTNKISIVNAGNFPASSGSIRVCGVSFTCPFNGESILYSNSPWISKIEPARIVCKSGAIQSLKVYINPNLFPAKIGEITAGIYVKLLKGRVVIPILVAIIAAKSNLKIMFTLYENRMKVNGETWRIDSSFMNNGKIFINMTEIIKAMARGPYITLIDFTKEGPFTKAIRLGSGKLVPGTREIMIFGNTECKKNSEKRIYNSNLKPIVIQPTMKKPDLLNIRNNKLYINVRELCNDFFPFKFEYKPSNRQVCVTFDSK